MFQGFNQSTIRYYEAIRHRNSRESHQEHLELYLEGVKYPLEELYLELSNYFSRLDRDLLAPRRRCMSSLYNDARFCGNAPIKEYFYVRFKLDTADGKNALGFFFDASLDRYKYGLQIYHLDARGMERFRAYLLDHRHSVAGMVERFEESGLLQVLGERYLRCHYPEVEHPALRDWLEHKKIAWVHEQVLDPAFYARDILNQMCAGFDSAAELYFMGKEALGGR